MGINTCLKAALLSVQDWATLDTFGFQPTAYLYTFRKSSRNNNEKTSLILNKYKLKNIAKKSHKGKKRRQDELSYDRKL